MFIKELGYEIKVIQSTGPVAIKDIDKKQGIVIGYFSHFNSKDSDGDIILKGAYTKSIQERGPKSSNPRIKHLLDHSRTNAIAVIKDLQEDEIGLRYESKAGQHTNGRDWLLMCEDGIITEHSVGFETIKAENKADGNHMSELLLWEGSSLQAWGSNQNTPVVGLKALKTAELGDRIANIEKGIRNGKYSDEAFIGLEKELKAIKHLLSLLTIDTIEPEHSDETTQPGLKYDDYADVIKHFKNNLNR